MAYGEEEDGVRESEDLTVQSKKPEVIDILFDQLIGTHAWPSTQPLVVDSTMLVEAIRERNARHPGEKGLSTNNPANFLKDFIRKPTCNGNWPRRLVDKKITARQVYGSGQVFEFVPFADGDLVPFPDRFDPTPDLSAFPFEALTIPLEARKLGRNDEPWLIQIAVSQRLIATHLAIAAARSGLAIETLAHLQVSVKTQPEIDATFVAVISSTMGERIRAYVTVEAKQFGERILEHQIREQIRIAFKLTAALSGEDSIDAVLPIVVKVVGDHPASSMEAERRYIYIAQFEIIARKDFEAHYFNALHEIPLVIQSASLYEPHPPIAGISAKPAKPRKALASVGDQKLKK